jgi:hypothetical protein
MGASLSIVGFAAGGPADIIARLISQWLSEWLAQQFIVTMIVRTPLLSIRLSMALKPGLVSMGSAPLTAASDLRKTDCAARISRGERSPRASTVV